MKGPRADPVKIRRLELEHGIGLPETTAERTLRLRPVLRRPAPEVTYVPREPVAPWVAVTLWRTLMWPVILIAFLAPPIEFAAPLTFVFYIVYRAGLEELS